MHKYQRMQCIQVQLDQFLFQRQANRIVCQQSSMHNLLRELQQQVKFYLFLIHIEYHVHRQEREEHYQPKCLRNYQIVIINHENDRTNH